MVTKNDVRESVLKNIIPILLCISIVSISMYNYGKKFFFLYLLITALFQPVVFVFFDFLSKKSVLFRFVSILGSFFAMCAMVLISLSLGYDTNSVEFFVWFLSPQALVNFSASYIIAIFIIINFFIASTVYYFSIVRYRISMTFLITLIPFAFYRKEGEKIPVVFAMILLVLYVALMIHCRQINHKPGQKLIINHGYRRSIVMFLAFTIFVSVICPKPDFHAANNLVNSLLDSDKLSQYMLKKLGLVSDTSYTPDVYTNPTQTELFTFITDDYPINLKSQTYSEYDYSRNVWKSTDVDVHGEYFESSDNKKINPQLFYEAVSAAAASDKDFAKKYNISDISAALSYDYSRKISLINSFISTKYCLVPTNTYKVVMDSEAYIAPNGMVFKNGQSSDRYSLYYYSQDCIYEKDYCRLLYSLNADNYQSFLEDLKDIISENDSLSNDYSDIVGLYIKDWYGACDYEDTCSSRDKSEIPESISDLAHHITDRYDSVFEKANAIEIYFRNNDFKYDLTYKKPSDYDMEYFLTKGKTGICTDYATAMVLLSRSVGIPARYAEGAAIQKVDENTSIAHVTDADLHAFPELFIPGYGWKTYEPTQVEEADTNIGYNYKLTIIIIGSTVLLVVMSILTVKYIYPWLYMIIFRIRVKKADNKKAAGMIMRETGKCIKAADSMTANEITLCVQNKYMFDISMIEQAFETAQYADMQVQNKTISENIRIYETLRKKIKQTQKAEKALRKMKKKGEKYERRR